MTGTPVPALQEAARKGAAEAFRHAATTAARFTRGGGNFDFAGYIAILDKYAAEMDPE